MHLRRPADNLLDRLPHRYHIVNIPATFTALRRHADLSTLASGESPSRGGWILHVEVGSFTWSFIMKKTIIRTLALSVLPVGGMAATS